MTTEMVERGARALYESASKNVLSPIPPPWAECPGDTKTEFIQHARAMIEAIREPTTAMSEAGDLAARAEGAHDCEVPMSDVWRAMIDAALGK